MALKKIFIAGFFLLIFNPIFAQRNFDGYNLFGVTAGLTFFDINTSDFITSPLQGFSGGFCTRGAFWDNFDLIYGINFQNSNLEIEAQSIRQGEIENIKYSIKGVQLKFLGSYNIAPKHLSLEFGPLVHINGRMKLDDERFKDYILKGYSITTAEDIQDISKVELRLAAGITAGLEHFRLSGQYQYGVTNTLAKLNTKNLEKNDFKGNSSTVILAITVYF